MAFSPLQALLVPHGLHPLYFQRFRQGWRTNYKKWCEITREIYARPMNENSTAFWACLRRAIPGAFALQAPHRTHHLAHWFRLDLQPCCQLAPSLQPCNESAKGWYAFRFGWIKR